MTTTEKLAEALRNGIDAMQESIDRHIQNYGQNYRAARLHAMTKDLQEAHEALAAWEAERAAPADDLVAHLVDALEHIEGAVMDIQCERRTISNFARAARNAYQSEAASATPAAPAPARHLSDEQISDLIGEHAGYGGDDIHAVVRAALAAAGHAPKREPEGKSND